MQLSIAKLTARCLQGLQVAVGLVWINVEHLGSGHDRNLDMTSGDDEMMTLVGGQQARYFAESCSNASQTRSSSE